MTKEHATQNTQAAPVTTLQADAVGSEVRRGRVIDAMDTLSDARALLHLVHMAMETETSDDQNAIYLACADASQRITSAMDMLETEFLPR